MSCLVLTFDIQRGCLTRGNGNRPALNQTEHIAICSQSDGIHGVFTRSEAAEGVIATGIGLCGDEFSVIPQLHRNTALGRDSVVERQCTRQAACAVCVSERDILRDRLFLIPTPPPTVRESL